MKSSGSEPDLTLTGFFKKITKQDLLFLLCKLYKKRKIEHRKAKMGQGKGNGLKRERGHGRRKLKRVNSKATRFRTSVCML